MQVLKSISKEFSVGYYLIKNEKQGRKNLWNRKSPKVGLYFLEVIEVKNAKKLPP